jgi:myo-inositol catabolism protein IolC
MPRGFDRQLYIQPFDHRGSFQTKMFGWQSPLSDTQTAEIAAVKRVVYDGFLAALAGGVPKEKAGILVDEQFGAAILRDAASRNIVTACPAEKSGQHEFDFEYGEDFMQLDRLAGDKRAYDLELRPRLMVEAIQELQDRGVEPDLWKLEGLDLREDCERVVAAARAGGRHTVGCIVLGRGEDDRKVREWLEIAATVPGFIGFAIGRTVFLDPLAALRSKQATRDQTVAEIARRYREFVDLFDRKEASQSPVASSSLRPERRSSMEG